MSKFPYLKAILVQNKLDLESTRQVTSYELQEYLDNKGNIIKDTTKLKQINNPEKIGEYEKEQFSIEKIYYVKK